MQLAIRLIWAGAVLGALLCPAQENRGAITGTITDPSNAAVPNAEVTVANVATNVVFRNETTSAGIYTFRMLEPGTYRLHAQAAGFKPLVFERVEVQTGATVGLNLQLEIGDVSQTVEVSVQAPLLNTASADSGQVIDQKHIEDLPMNGRSPYTLARLSPGVIVAGMVNNTKPYDVGGNSYVSIGGSRRYTTEFAMNGVPNILPFGYFSGRVTYTPPVDATQEFRVVTNGFAADHGHSGAGVISVTTKSGTNAFHGSLYDFLQNDKLNATNFFVNRAGGKKPPQRTNQFGGSLGGPVTVPKLIYGKDRVFFFFSYEGIRNSVPGAAYATLPTDAMRHGDFSALLARNITVYDPMSAAKDPSGKYVRTAFPGDIVPTDRFSPIARAVLNYVPLPTAPGLENNYFSSNGSYDLYNNYLGRLDINATAKQRMFVSIGQYTRTTTSTDVFRSFVTGSRFDTPMWTVAADDTYTVSPNLLVDLRLGFTSYTSDSRPDSIGFDITKLGFPASLAGRLVEGAFPRVDMSYFTGFGAGNRSTHATTIADTYFAALAATYIHGSHNTRFGFEAREKQDNEWNRGNSSGGYAFDGQFTAGPGIAAGPAFGNDMAAFLLGLPASGSVNISAPAALRARYYAWFVQDDWKITPALTANLGLRYDLESPGYERHDRIVNRWLNGPNPIAAQAIANYARAPDPALPVSQFKVNGGVLFAGVNGMPSEIWNWDYKRIQPRFGLAWNPNILKRRLSVRAGGGISYFNMAPPSGSTGIWQYGYAVSTPFVATADSGVSFIGTLSNPFPNGLQQPTGNTLGPLSNLGQGVDAVQRVYLPTRSNRWQFSIQTQVTAHDVVEVNYTGTNNNHVITGWPYNSIPNQFMGTSLTRDQAAINFLTAPIRNPFLGLIPASTPVGKATIPRAQLLSLFPQFTTVYNRQDNSGSITFQSVYFAWERRLARGLTMLANYMISKQLWARDHINMTDTVLDRRPGPEDHPQQLTLSGSYDLPFGRGKALLAGAPGAVNRIVSGWQLGGIYFAQSGAALTWGAMVFTGKSWGDIMNVPGGRSIDQWFNTSVFNRNAADQPNPAYQFRYFPLGVGPARGPGANTLDFSISKRTRMRERTDLQFRAEFFNFLNHPNFGGPNTTPTSNQFGKISSQANTPRSAQVSLRLTF